MTERMLAKYGNYFSGALISCAAIAKNGQPVELPLVVDNTNKENKPVTSVQTGDDTQIVLLSCIALLSAGAFITIKKYVH